MIHYKSLFFSCVFVLFWVWSIPAKTQNSNLDKVDQYLQNYLSSIPVPGFSMVIVEGDKVIFNKGYGLEKEGGSKRMSPKSVLNIGSIGRGFTAIAVLQLVEKGTLDLDVPIVEYLPWFKTANKEYSDLITLRMCLSNTSGIPPQYESLPELEPQPDSESFIRTFESLFIKRIPGLSHEFCDEGYSIAGLIISEVTGMSYIDYVTENIIVPLGMNRSAVGSKNASELDVVLGHEMGLTECYPAEKTNTDPNFIASGSEYYSCTSDLGNYMMALLNEGKYSGYQIISQSSIEELFQSNTSFQGLGTMLGGNGIDIGYALGWMEMEIEDRTIHLHTGNTGNVASIIGVNRDKNQAFAILYNADINRLDRVEYPGMENTVNNVIHLLNGEMTTDFGVVRDNQVFEEDFVLQQEKWHKYLGKYESFGEASPLFKDMNIEVKLNEEEKVMELIARQEETFKGHYELEFTNESRAILRSIAQPSEIQFTIYPDGAVGGLFMFGSEFKKRDPNILDRYTNVYVSKPRASFMLPKSVNITLKDGIMNVDLSEYGNATMEVFISELNHVSFTEYLEDQLASLNVKSKGILSKSKIRDGLWSEQSIITSGDEGLSQNIYALYQDPVSDKQMSLTIKQPWGNFSSELLDVLHMIQRSISFIE